MASDIFNVEPPSWLQRSVSGQPQSLNKLAGMAGNYIGAGATTLTGSGDPEIESRPGYQRFRTNLANNYKQEQDPMWRLKEIGLRSRLAQLKLQADNYGFTNKLRQQTMMQQAASLQELDTLKQEALTNGGNPLDVPYLGSNPFTQKQWGNVQLQYSRGLVSKRLDSDRVRINKLVDDLDEKERSVFLQMPRGDDGMPTAEGWDYINAATSIKQARIDSKNNRPASGPGRLMYDIEEAKKLGKDTKALDNALNKETASTELIFSEQEIGGKKYTSITQKGKGGFRLVAHEGDNKMLLAKLQAAYRQKQSAINALTKAQTELLPGTKKVAQDALDSAEATIDELESQIQSGATTATPTPESEPAPAPKSSAPVKFIFKGGKLVPQ